MIPQGFPEVTQPAHQPPPVDRARGQRQRVRILAVFLGAGCFTVLVGGVFLLPFALSPYAIQNDVYMGNLFLGVPFLIVGGIMVLVGLVGLSLARGLGHRRWWLGLRPVLLALVGAAVVALVILLFGGRFYSVGPSAPEWPPYLTLPLVGVTLVVGLVVSVLAGWVDGADTTRSRAAP